MDRLVEKEQADANLAAVTNARLADLVLKLGHSFSGSKKKATGIPKDWLPFPDYRPQAKEADHADEPTRFILSELVHRFEIPVYVFVALTGRVDDSR